MDRLSQVEKKEFFKNYYKKNKEKIQEMNKKYYKKNKESFIIYYKENKKRLQEIK